MRLIVVSGLSGSGKGIALNTLEDLGYYCVDNLPANLLPALVEQLVEMVTTNFENAAVSIDARNPKGLLERFPEIFPGMQGKDCQCELLFMEADDEILTKRFSETRRKHPLTGKEVSLSEAICRERTLLQPLADHADIRIDTSRTNLHQLRDIIRSRVDRRSRDSLSLLIQSFGFKRGAPWDADFVFDVRCLPNPHWEKQLRSLTGLDREVAEFLDNEPLVRQMYEDLKSFLDDWIPRFLAENRSYLTVALGCTGGQHRSVYIADRLARYFQGRGGASVMVRHRELS